MPYLLISGELVVEMKLVESKAVLATNNSEGSRKYLREERKWK